MTIEAPADQGTRDDGQLSDALLVDRARDGDTSSFEQLVERHGPVVHRVAARIVGPDDANDVSQDAFLRAYNALPRFRGESPFRSWLLQITHNAAVSHATRRRPEPVDPADAADDEGSDRTEIALRNPVQALEQKERVRRLEGKIRLLRMEHRSVLVLRDVEGLTYEEIGLATDTPIGSVKGRLHRARRELIDLLRRNTYDWNLPE